MQTTVQKWGNSLALRIPKFFATEIGLEKDTSVDMTVIDGKLLVARLASSPYSLEELLAVITDENLHQEQDFGPPVGGEVW